MVGRILILLPALAGVCSAAPAKDAGFKSCVGGGPKVPSLREIVDCQKGVKKDLLESYAKADRTPPSGLADRLEDFQKAEVRKFLSKHPEKATMASAQEAADDPGSAQGDIQPSQPGVLGMVRALLERGKDAFRGLIPSSGGSAKPASDGNALPAIPGNVQGEAEEAAGGLSKELQSKGIDLERAKEDVRRDPVGAAHRAVDNYNRDLDKNLDPGVRRLFAKPGAKPSAQTEPAEE